MKTLNPKVYIAIFAVIIVIISVITLFASRSIMRDSDPSFTGGSGEVATGYLILSGYETPVNQGSKAPLGMYFDSSQQTAIRSYLEVALYNKQPLTEYRGEILPGSADVDFSKNTVQFKVQVKKPKAVYTVQFNSLTNELHIFDEEGNEIKTDS